MATILVAGMQHETNTFSPISTTLQHFQQADNWPGWLDAEALIPAVSGKAIPIAGFIARAQQLGHDCIPLQWCAATPSGVVTAEAFDTIVSGLLAAVAAQGNAFDAIYLDLHGAMVSAVARDGDGEILRRVRAMVGEHRWLMASLDCHANVSAQMFEMADLLVSYRTYPHVDMAQTGARVADCYHHYQAAQCKPEKRFFAFDFQLPLLAGCSLIEPAVSVFQALAVDEQSAALSLSFNPGFPLADTVETKPTCLVYSPDTLLVQQHLDQLVQSVQSKQDQFVQQLWSPRAAIDWVLTEAKPAAPVIFADTQDNPGGGGSGDTTGILRALLAEPNISSALVASVFDPVAADCAFRAGVGALIDIQLGEWQGATESAPLDLRVEVLSISDQLVQATGPFYAGCQIDLGKVVRVRVQQVEVLIASRNVQAADQAMLTHLGAVPSDYQILVLKSSVHFRADFQSLAQQILVVESPGLNQADLSALSYRYLTAATRS